MHEPEAFAWKFCPICGKVLEPAHDGEAERPYCAPCRRFYYRNPVPAVCCFVTRGDELLLVRRGVEPCRGQWSLPGGFVELGEGLEHAVARELREETGLRAGAMRLIGAHAQESRWYGGVLLLAYAVDDWTGEPASASDAEEARFFALADRPPLAFPAHDALLALFEQGRGGRETS